MTTNTGVKLTQLAELSISDQQRAQSFETLGSPIGISASRLSASRAGDSLEFFTGDLLGIPDELLYKLAVVLGKEEQLGLVNDVTKVLDQGLTFFGQFL